MHFSPQVFARLAQLQVPNGPRFPSLHRLSVMGPSTALDFLHLFLTPSLTTLEIAAIPVDGVQYPLILSFLESAICDASHIKDVILGPGQISGEILDICLKYQNLQHLELSSATLSIALQDFERIGSLERLESFVLQGPSTPVKRLELPVTPQEPEYDPQPPPPAFEQNFGFGSSLWGQTSWGQAKLPANEDLAQDIAVPNPPTLRRSPSPSE